MNVVQLASPVVWEITTDHPVYFDIRSDRIKPIAKISASKTAGDSHTQSPACKIAGDFFTQPSAWKIVEINWSSCKAADIVGLYFSDGEK